MDILEHPLEAVAFRLYSLPVPNVSASGGAAAWTCLATVLAAAAAAGLCRLRSSAPAASLMTLELEPSDAKDMSPETTTNSSARSPDSVATTVAAPALKERYTAYYRVGCCDVDGEEGYSDAEEEDAEEQGEDDGAYQTSAEATDPFGWEAVRSSSLPRSPTAAEVGRSGSVVRLWDEVVDAGVSPRRWRGRVVVSAF